MERFSKRPWAVNSLKLEVKNITVNINKLTKNVDDDKTMLVTFLETLMITLSVINIKRGKNKMLVTDFECWRHKTCLSDIFSMRVPINVSKTCN